MIVMNRIQVALLGAFTFFLTGSVQAQLYVGPALNAGLTYGKNFITPDTSQYYIGNSPSMYFAGGLDLAYQFDENIRVQLGAGYSYKQFVLQAPDGREGLSFEQIKRKATAISIPMTINYRFPIGDGGKAYFNVMAGHSLDFTHEDSTKLVSSITPVDSGGIYFQHLYNNNKLTVPTVLLGIGSDIQFDNGNILNISAVWGIGTGKIFDGSIQEWNVLNQDFDPNDANRPLPEEFPEHFFEWAMRGSTISVRASYLFDMSSLFGKKDEAVEGDKPVEAPEKTERP